MALPEWLEVVPLSGKGDMELAASAPAHTGRVARSFITTGTPSVGEPDTMEIEQEGKTAFVEVSNIPASGVFDVPSGGGSVMIEGESNAAELVLDSSSDPMPVKSAALQAAGTIYPLSGMAEAVVLTGDPGAAAQYAFRYGLAFGDHLGRSDRTWYGRVEGDAPELSYPKGSDYFRIIHEGAEKFITYQGSLVGITVPANGVLAREFNGESNLMSLSFRRGDSSPWARALPMAASIIATGKDSGEVKTVEVAEADTLYDIPDDPGADEAYAWRLAVTRFPANTGRVAKSGLWLVGDSSVNQIVVQIRQASPGEFCESDVKSSYSLSHSISGYISIKGTSNCTCISLRNAVNLTLPVDAELYIDGSKASEWDPLDTSPGNIYEFRGEDEAYEWEIRLNLAKVLSGGFATRYRLSWCNQSGATTQLALFTVNRP